MKTNILIVAVLLSIFWACGTESSTKSETIIVEKPQWVEIDANTGGYNLQIFVPILEIVKGEPSIKFMENTGELNIRAGEYFDYSLYEDESQMETTINEIKHHPFYEVEIVQQTDSTLLYRYYVEGMDKENWQFYTERSLGNPLLIVRSNNDMIFSEFYARKMMDSALKITPLN
jgi:hypothetical protein